jgi:RimJ/RimL family protein N-acetyltransferase
VKNVSIIKSHGVTLYGGNGSNIILKPLCDQHLPLLYKWNSDLELLYWTEGDDVSEPYRKETVHKIYGDTSQDAFCFLIEVNKIPIGECWLQKMNMPDVIAMYPENLDVRRIDMAIGEKEYWNRGIGTQFIGMLVDFAFNGEYVDVLHCFCYDYNKRSQRMWEKNNFTLIKKVKHEHSQKSEYEYHYALTRQQYVENRRVKVSDDKVFMFSISELQPSQLYISEGKLRLANEWFDKADITKVDAIPIKEFQGKKLMTDGHTRAVLAYLNGFTEIPCYLDTDELDMAAYAVDIAWCDAEGVSCVADLAKRIVSHKNYEVLWRKRCMEMYESNENFDNCRKVRDEK